MIASLELIREYVAKLNASQAARERGNYALAQQLDQQAQDRWNAMSAPTQVMLQAAAEREREARCITDGCRHDDCEAAAREDERREEAIRRRDDRREEDGLDRWRGA